MAWEYPDGSLIALCDDCHGRIVHGILDKEPNREASSIKNRSNRIEEIVHDINYQELLRSWRPNGVRAASRSIMLFFASHGRRLSESASRRVLFRLIDNGHLESKEGLIYSKEAQCPE
jgi:hypothetical protein